MKLYEIEKDYDVLYEIMNTEDDLTAEQQQILLEFLNENDKALEDKLENYVKVIRNFEADQDKIDNEIKILKRKKEVLENNEKSLKENIKYFMKKFNKKQQKAGIFNFTLKTNQAALKITGVVPDDYMIPQPSISNNAKIKEILLNNEKVEDELLKVKIDFAELTRSESLQIK